MAKKIFPINRLLFLAEQAEISHKELAKKGE
jgi:hypothetical protein